jgi:hypothetical protein
MAAVLQPLLWGRRDMHKRLSEAAFDFDARLEIIIYAHELLFPSRDTTISPHQCLLQFSWRVIAATALVARFIFPYRSAATNRDV